MLGTLLVIMCPSMRGNVRSVTKSRFGLSIRAI